MPYLGSSAFARDCITKFLMSKMWGNNPHISHENLIASSAGLAELVVVHSTSAVGVTAASCRVMVKVFCLRFVVKYAKCNATDISKYHHSLSKSHYTCSVLFAPTISYVLNVPAPKEQFLVVVSRTGG
jgi:hypothetical protein